MTLSDGAHFNVIAASLVLFLAGQHASAAGQELDFTLPSATDDSLIRLADHSGQVVLVNWFRTTCAWSQQETPKLAELYRRHEDDGFAIIGVADENSGTAEDVPAYAKEHGVTWPIGLNDQGEFMRNIRPMGRGQTPGNYLISRDGTITYLGLDREPEDWDRLVAAVEAALAEPMPGESEEAAIPRRAMEPAPPFSLEDLDGNTVSLEEFSGRPLLVHYFTGSTCGWAGDVVSGVHRDFAGRGLQVIGINLFDDDAAIERCVERHDIEYPILRGTQEVQRAWIGSSSAWAVFFVTSDGEIFKKIVDSINNGIEEPVFRWYAEYLLEE